MLDDKIKERLAGARSLEEVKEILKGNSNIDPERVWKENERHRSLAHEKLDLNELDAVSGGADRDWKRDGCAATCEVGSWCSSNDYCVIWDVTYDNFWATCPDGHEHVFENCVCVRCGYKNEGYSPG